MGLAIPFGMTTEPTSSRESSKLTVAKAKLVIIDLAKQDRENSDVTRTPTKQIEAWYRSAGEAGDMGVVDAIDKLGKARAAAVYAIAGGYRSCT